MADWDSLPDRKRGGNGYGVAAYRGLMAAGIAVLAALSWRTVESIDRNSQAVVTLRIELSTLASTMDGRLNAQADRLAGHDRRFERIEDRLIVKGMP